MTFTMKLELVPIPVRDIDRAKAFYSDQLGFNVDHDVSPNEEVRIVQLTPRGSGCSIVIGKGMGDLDLTQRGLVKGLHLVVEDIDEARQALVDNGVSMERIVDMGGVKYAGFSDPDGNTWTLQQVLPRG